MRAIVASSRTEYWAALIVLATACTSKKRHDAPRDPRSECAAIFDRYHAALSPLLAELRITETAVAARTRNAKALTSCEGWSPPQRACLLTMPPGASAWTTCKVESSFALYDPSAAHTRLLGEPLTKQESERRVAELTGTWNHPSVGKNDVITWSIATGGKLDVHTISTDTAGKQSARDQTYQLEFERERELALRTGTAVQFVPAYVEGDRLYVSWTTGAIAIPIPNPQSFALDLADRDRWIVWTEPTCKLFDPRLGPVDATCSWQGERFIVRHELDGTPRELAWTRHAEVLVHPAMEPFTRQGT
jgi:hypothetical protein